MFPSEFGMRLHSGMASAAPWSVLPVVAHLLHVSPALRSAPPLLQSEFLRLAL